MSRCFFRLTVQQIDRTCLFQLTWNQGQQLTATLPYPPSLKQSYQQWQTAYLNFYRTALRAKVAATGKIAPNPEEWHRQLDQSEAKLLYEFDLWLRSHELYDIRAEIARAAQSLTQQKINNPTIDSCYIDLFVTCSSIELAKYPWETWELSAEMSSLVKFRITRTPARIRKASKAIVRKKQSKARILAILGDDTGLNFQQELQALNSLKQIAEFKLLDWQPESSPAAVKQQICQALEDPMGWDVLFFVGHSNETAITGGELAIAPGVAISISEIESQLQTAQQLGLQFALFNSCNGLSIAYSLIDLGLSQVAVMREPIHNRVAQVFLVKFLAELAQYHDVHDALIATCTDLKRNNVTYPSGFLIPSLFCYPESQLFRLQPWGWRSSLRQWLPTRTEAFALAALATVSCLLPVQQYLLSRRVLSQAIYRDSTGQTPPETLPPVLLVQIDEQSIERAGISDPYPMKRDYLANIIDRLADLDVEVLGVDYLLDRQQPNNDPILARSIRHAIEENQTWFVFAAIENAMGEEIGAIEDLVNLNWSLQGSTHALPQYLRLPENSSCDQSCPFTYLLALVYAWRSEFSDLLQPKLDSSSDFRTQLFDSIDQEENIDTILFLRQLQQHPFTNLARNFNQQWLRPIVDYSLPPDVAYDTIPAWKLLETDPNLNRYVFDQQIVIVASGGYPQAGVTPGADNFAPPLAVSYWRSRYNLAPDNPDRFTGSEANAYMIHHLLTKRLVIPLPDLWLVAIAALIGKGFTLMFKPQLQPRKNIVLIWLLATTVYGLVALQLYISAAILLPWAFPSATFLVYLLSSKNNKFN